MDIIEEKELLSILKKSKNVLLIEPYLSKYIPLGLAKIASYIKYNGGSALFSKIPIPGKFDLICFTTVFTTDSEIIIKTIKQCQNNIFLKDIPIIVGGIFASLMPNYIIEKTKVKVFVGFSKKLDSFLPDYTIDYKIKGFFKDAMTLFTTRGCPNKCGYCMVWRMESNTTTIIPSWKKNIVDIDRKVCLVSDNNFLNAPYEFIREVVQTLNENKKEVIFNNGVDCKFIDKNKAPLLASLKYTRMGYRTAFDKMDQDGYYQKAMERVIKCGLKVKGNSYTYVLYNYNDTPQEAYYRGKECWKYGSCPYFMRYRPLNQLTKKNKHIGKYWTLNLIRALSYYGATYGFNRGDRTFEGWMKSTDNIKLTKEDWEKWHFKKG